MNGDEFVRHCAQCNKNVYDLSELTSQQAVDLIREKEGNLCAVIYRRKDGTVLTADCLVGRRSGLRRVLKRSLAFAASILTLGAIVGCDDLVETSASSQTQTFARKTEKEKCGRTAGVIIPRDFNKSQPNPQKNPPSNGPRGCD
jgi:hypothetical protein